jgi:hypothetical protein
MATPKLPEPIGLPSSVSNKSKTFHKAEWKFLVLCPDAVINE